MSSNSVFVFRIISLFPELDFEARFTYSDVVRATGIESGDTTGTVPVPRVGDFQRKNIIPFFK